MLENRLTAFENISSLPLPRVEKTNIENWNFTQFNPYQQEKVITDLTDLPDELNSYLLSDSNVLIQKNSTNIYKAVDEKIEEQGVVFTDLATAIKSHESFIKTYFMHLGAQDNRLAAIHAALTSGGVFLYVPPNTEVTVPLQSLFWATGKEAAILPHIMVIVEHNSRLDLVTGFIGDDQAALNNTMFEVFVGDHSHVRITTVNHFGQSTVDTTYRNSIVGQDAQLHWICCDLNEGHAISSNRVDLNGPGAELTIKSVALGVNNLRSNTTSEVHHWGRNTSSDIHTRSVMKDSASNIINSITKIEHGATKADGQQSSKVLMLDEKARGDANPILLIDENDVTAGHAASVGRVDPMHVFYLMSRGISKRKAEKLIIDGFLDAVISQIPSEPLQKSIHAVIGRKF